MHVCAKFSTTCAKFYLLNAKLKQITSFNLILLILTQFFCVLWPFWHIFMHNFFGLKISSLKWRSLLESLIIRQPLVNLLKWMEWIQITSHLNFEKNLSLLTSKLLLLVYCYTMLYVICYMLFNISKCLILLIIFSFFSYLYCSSLQYQFPV